MYRDVEQGLGVFEAVKQVTLGGPRLPWVTTLGGLGYVEGQWLAWLAIAATTLAIVLVWHPWSPARVARPARAGLGRSEAGL
jgi:hypothetical protein